MNVVEKVQVVEKLPKGWKWVKLGDVSEIVSKGTTPTSLGHSYTSKGIPFLRAEDVTGRAVDSDRVAFCISNETHGFLSRSQLQTGDLLITIAGTLGRVGYVPEEAPPLNCNQAVAFIRLIPQLINVQYACFACQLNIVTSSFDRLQAGGTIKNLNLEQVRGIVIPLPPLPEQKRIVAILTDRLSTIDKARAATEVQLKAAKALPAAYLREVFDSPEAQKWKRKKLGDIALIVQNGIYKSSEYYGSGYPLLRMYNLKNSSWKLDFTTIAQVILDDDELRRFSLEIGDLLVSRVNSFELVGKCGWVDSEAKNYVFENMLIRVRLIDSVDSLFIAQQMGYRKIREQIQAVAKQAIGQASINSTDIRNIELQVPPLDKQKCVAMELSEKTQQSEKLQKSLQSQLDTINQLPAALLRQAFNGEL